MWKQIKVRVLREQVAALEGLLEEHGALSVTLTDPDDTPVLEPGVGETPLWPKVVVTGLFDDGHETDELVASLSDFASMADIEFSKVADKDWERAWLDDFHPMQFGSELWIIPGDQEPPDPGATNIELDPGLAFGSGTHQTTRLCLEWIDAQAFEGKSVIDFGCGSGILGIATALKGAKPVLCVDNDPQALQATDDNAARNRVADRVETLDSSAFTGKAADIILANILAGTLVQLMPLLCNALKPGGRIALSGILEDQTEQVRSAYVDQITDIEVRTLDEWVLISGNKRVADVD
jgi:ribosomal protein L11 methyltransferase